MNDDNDNRRAYHDDVDDADYGTVGSQTPTIVMHLNWFCNSK